MRKISLLVGLTVIFPSFAGFSITRSELADAVRSLERRVSTIGLDAEVTWDYWEDETKSWKEGEAFTKMSAILSTTPDGMVYFDVYDEKTT